MWLKVKGSAKIASLQRHHIWKGFGISFLIGVRSLLAWAPGLTHFCPVCVTGAAFFTLSGTLLGVLSTF